MTEARLAERPVFAIGAGLIARSLSGARCAMAPAIPPEGAIAADAILFRAAVTARRMMGEGIGGGGMKMPRRDSEGQEQGIGQSCRKLTRFS